MKLRLARKIGKAAKACRERGCPHAGATHGRSIKRLRISTGRYVGRIVRAESCPKCDMPVFKHRCPCTNK